MTVVVTDADLQKLVTTSISTSVFISTATTVVTEELAGKGLTDDRLNSIALYLAAHLAVLSEEKGGLKRSKLGDADDSYKIPGDKDQGLASTRFGQVVMMLDTTGTLAGLTANKGLKGLFELVGSGIKDGYETL